VPLGSARFLDRLERLPKPVVIAGAPLLVVGIALLDWCTPIELSLAVFHVLPVFLAAWLLGRSAGLALATAAAISWFLADTLHPEARTALQLLAGDLATKVLFFVVISELVCALRVARDLVHEEARTDPLTGLLNRRAFYERADKEIGRARRSGAPLVLAYIDVDDFKSVNDRFGHETGDRVLVALGRALSQCVRDTDVVARLGGDEFAVLFPDTDAVGAAAIAVQLEGAVAGELGALEMTLGFSLGLAPWSASFRGLDDLLRSADSGMYRVKAGRKGEDSPQADPGGPLSHDRRSAPGSSA
jgi:diguanylate cyclase (GGDEF)-like protein